MDAAQPEVEIVRSARRQRSASAAFVDGRIVVRVPAHLSRAEVDRIVPGLVNRVVAKQRGSRPTDLALAERATRLSRTHLGGLAVPASVRWVTNQRSRWGSCTPVTREIRLSSRLQGMPDYVIDFVLLHELAHLLQPDHGRSFHALLAGYRQRERAEAYLAGASFGASLPALDELDDLSDGPAADAAPA
ncbi:M48 metallopeptidase family protein [Calidifontibacter terrae]